jgi:hypothetical protein
VLLRCCLGLQILVFGTTVFSLVFKLLYFSSTCRSFLYGSNTEPLALSHQIPHSVRFSNCRVLASLVVSTWHFILYIFPLWWYYCVNTGVQSIDDSFNIRTSLLYGSNKMLLIPHSIQICLMVVLLLFHCRWCSISWRLCLYKLVLIHLLSRSLHAFECTRAIWETPNAQRAANKFLTVKVLFFRGKFILY